MVLGVSLLGHRAGQRRAESNGREAGRGQRESPAQKVTVKRLQVCLGTVEDSEPSHSFKQLASVGKVLGHINTK